MRIIIDNLHNYINPTIVLKNCTSSAYINKTTRAGAPIYLPSTSISTPPRNLGRRGAAAALGSGFYTRGIRPARDLGNFAKKFSSPYIYIDLSTRRCVSPVVFALCVYINVRQLPRAYIYIIKLSRCREKYIEIDSAL